MRKSIVIAFAIMIGLAGCKQQQQKQTMDGPVAYPGGAPMISPDQVRTLEGLAKANPKNVDGWIALGNALMDTQRFGEAVDAYQKALAIDPKNVDVRVDMGTCYRGIRQFDKALAEFRKAMKINPNHLNAHRNSGVVLAVDLNRKAEAIKEFEKYLELAPDAPDAMQLRQSVKELKAAK